MEQNAPQQDSMDGFAEVGPEWAALVKRLKIAGEHREGIVLTDRDVQVLNRALRALTGYIMSGLKRSLASLFVRAGMATDKAGE